LKAKSGRLSVSSYRNIFYMSLSIAQTTALAAFYKFLEQPTEPVFLLRGYAGTGKTFLLKTLLADLAARERKAVLLAPTGRAARVMAHQAGRQDAATIHRGIYDFRQLKPLHEGKTDAEKSFKFYFALAVNQYPQGTVFVVDEASMVGDAYSESEFFRLGSGHLLRDLLEYVAPTPANGYKLLLVGDRAQLPPVGDADSWALDEGWLSERLGLTLPLPGKELTEVMRQAAGSGILDNATAVREALRCKQFAGLKLTPGEDVRQVQAGELLTTYLAAGGKPEALSKAIIVTYSNNRAGFYNAQVRRHFFGAGMTEEFPAQPDLQIGDRLMVTQNNYLERMQPIYNGDFALVEQVGQPYHRRRSVRRGKTTLQVTLTWRPVKLKLRGADGQHYEVERLLLDDFLTSADNSLRPEQVKALYIDAVIRWRDKTGHDEKHPEFKQFLQADREFHALRAKYGYAITCHKAQGGTWNTAFVDFSGHSGQAHAHYFRWVYTALTRASKMLYLLSEGGFTPWEKMRVFDPNTTPPPASVPLWPEVKRAQTASFDPLDELEARLGITKRPAAQQQQFRRVATQLREVGAEIEAVSEQQHALRYAVRRGEARGEVLAYYKHDVPLSSVQPTGRTNTLTDEAVAKLREPLPTSTAVVPVLFGPELPPTLATFYEAFAEATAQQDITIMAVQHAAYCDRYLLADDSGLAELLVDYDGKNRISGVRLSKHDSPDLTRRVHEILSSLTN
jgi:hypothetical protein